MDSDFPMQYSHIGSLMFSKPNLTSVFLSFLSIPMAWTKNTCIYFLKTTMKTPKIPANPDKNLRKTAPAWLELSWNVFAYTKFALLYKNILLFLLMLSSVYCPPLQDSQGPSFVSITQHIIPYSRVSNCQSITKMLNNQCVPCPKSTWGHLWIWRTFDALLF